MGDTALEKYQAARSQYRAARSQIAVAIEKQYILSKELKDDKISMPQYLYCLGFYSAKILHDPPSSHSSSKYSATGRNVLVIRVMKNFRYVLPFTRPSYNAHMGCVTQNFLKSLKDARCVLYPMAKPQIATQDNWIITFMKDRNEWYMERRTPAIVMNKTNGSLLYPMAKPQIATQDNWTITRSRFV
jgi:hypothetical protein